MNVIHVGCMMRLYKALALAISPNVPAPPNAECGGQYHKSFARSFLIFSLFSAQGNENLRLFLHFTTSPFYVFRLYLPILFLYTTFLSILLCWLFSLINFKPLLLFLGVFIIFYIDTNSWIKSHIWLVTVIKGFNHT